MYTGRLALFSWSDNLLKASAGIKNRMPDNAERVKIAPAMGQCCILKRVPTINSNPAKKAEMNRKSLFVL